MPAPTLSGDTATYPEVFAGVDLQLRATVSGLREVLVVKSAAAAADAGLASVRFGIDGGGLSVGTGAGNITQATGSGGSEQLSAGAPSWWDSARPDSGPAGPGGPGLPRPAVATVTGSQVTLDVAAAAQTPGVRYPVFVDPDWTGYTQNYAFTDSAYPTQSYWRGAGNDGFQHVGFINAGNSDDGRDHTTQSFWQMDTSALAGKHVLAAHFNTTEAWASSCQPRPVQLWVTGAISPATTWNTYMPWYVLQDTQNVAFGYNSSCPTHAVGFVATPAATDAANERLTSITLGMRAQDEGDWLGWKKFTGTASLVVTYNSYPGSPVVRSVRPCPFVCASPVLTNSTTPTLTAATIDPDGGNLRYDFEVWRGHSANPTSEYAYGSVSNVPSGQTASWKVSGPVTEGDWEYRVRASDGIDYGPWSNGWVQFTVDTTAPAAPTLSASGPVSTSKNNYMGSTIGVSRESLTISSAAADHAWGYVYTIGTGQPDYPVNVSCNTSAAGYVVVCPGTVGASVTVVVTPVDEASVFTAWTFDAAGNVHGNPAAIWFYSMSDTTPLAGHQWRTDTGPVDVNGNPDTAPCPQDPVADSATAAGLPLSLSGGVCWGSDTVHAGPPPVGVLSFDGSTATATTTGPAVDTTHSFTVAAWVKPADASPTLVRPVLTEDGTSLSGFFLQNTADHWAFCLPSTEAPTYAGDCAVTTATVAPGTWVFLVGEWDAINHQARLYVSGGGSAPTQITVSHQAVPASTGPVAVGRDKIGSAYRYFNGEIYHPTVLPGVLSSPQIAKLGQSDMPPNQLSTAPPAG